MATYNFSQNILNNVIRHEETCQIVPTMPVTSDSTLGTDSSILSIPSTTTGNFTYGIPNNFDELAQYTNSTEGYVHTEVKREPCQVSEVTTSAVKGIQQSRSRHAFKTVLNRGVKIETISPKQPEVEEDISQKKTNDPMHPGTDGFKEWSREPVRDPLTNQSQREINYFGIRVADLATAGCGNIYLAGPSFVSAENTAEINPDIHSMNRSSSTFWQYPNSFSFDPVLSMSPIGLQYSRDSSRGQLVFLPTTTPIESFPQASFMWPTYIPQTSGNTLSTSQNLIIPSMTPQTNSQSLSYAPHIQLFGTNYLTTASTTASTAFCQHSQINRFVSLSSDIKRLDQTQKEYEMKTEDSDNEYNSLRKIEKIIASNAPKSKLENKSNCFQSTNAGFECSIPILPNEAQPIMIESSSTSSEFIASPICMPNLTQSTNQNGRIQITHDCASIPYTPEMQDVTIQTDTPVSSEDEILLEVSAVGPDSCREYLEHKRKSVLTDYQTNGNGGILIEKAQSKTIDTFKAGYVNQKEKKTVESEFSTVNKSNKSLDSSCSNKSNSPLNLHCTSLKETIQSVPEMSGLELLSNISTAAFDNHNAVKNVLIKTEPLESPNENILVTETPNRNTEHLNSEATAHVGQNDTQNSLPLSNNQLPLGGLNLLCALAEQRIQEEVQCDNHKETANKVSCDAKRRKCKHAKLKSRKSSYSKKNKRKLAKEIIECLQNTNSKSNNSKLHVNLRNVLKKVDSNYKKLSKWTDPQEFFIAMESDMRMRLADITRQYKKKKRKLDEINKLNKWKKPSSEYKFANISYKNPNFICFLEKCQKTASSIPPFEGMENKMDISAQNNKISGCVIDKYKNNLKSNLTEGRQLKYNTLFTKDRMSHKTQYSENENEKISSENKRKANKTTTSLRQPVITKNSINKNFNDKELILSVEHLYCKETRVLTDMGGLFYAGILKPLQPPDVYSVTLDGERGNKSHIMSREEIFKDTILEVTPKTIEHVPSGTRLCAYWSQQYRCLYPGKAIDSENDDKTSGFVTVEFDDGDSGKIRLENIRLLLSDYPIVEYSKNPFNTLGKYKKTACIKHTSAPKASEGQIYEGLDDAKRRTEIQNKDSNKISNSFNQDFSSAGNIHELNHEHRKHKKKKNKKNNLKSSLKPVSDKEHTKLNECEYNTKQPNFDYRNTNEDYRIDITSQYDSKTNLPIVLHAGCSQPIHSDAIPERSDKSKTREKGDAHNGKGSKIAAFLPERQLWSWLGHAYRRVGIKGRTRKSFYKSITRGKEIITVGECAVFLSTGRPDRPYIGRIEAMWETCSNKVVRVRWFYHPEETTGCPVLKYPGGLFVSPHEDENDVQTISHRCEVIEFSLYIAKFGINNYEQYQSVYDNNDTFYISGYYNPRLQFLKLEPDIPIGNNQP